MQNLFSHPSAIIYCVHILLVIVLSLRVINNRPATGTALAWLLLISALPYVGAMIYLLIGERRIGSRAQGIEDLRTDFRQLSQVTESAWLIETDWTRQSAAAQQLDQLGRNLVGSSTVSGSTLELFSDTTEILRRIAADVDAASTSVLMEFYIWNEGGAADDVLAALERAARRGVTCRILVDALGARPWWKGMQPKRLRDAGVEVRPALPVGFFRTLVGRSDLRLHRKIVIIDGEVAWTGSMNMVDPGFFKQDAGVGEWVDAMVRVRGSAVLPLAATMIGDWILETSESLISVVESTGLTSVRPAGAADIQVIPSGPGQSGDGMLQMILGLINAAREELWLTTPYLVPDESLLRALRGAAGRGVQVRLIVPEKVDSFLTRYASRSYYDDLLEIGVEIHLYRGGLLHTKSITVDGAMSMFGTVNLDMRSLWLNYEVALFVYDAEFALQLRKLQDSYLLDSHRIDLKYWGKRSPGRRLLENIFRLVSPLL